MKRINMVLVVFVLVALMFSSGTVQGQSASQVRVSAMADLEEFVFFDDFFTLNLIDTTGSTFNNEVSGWLIKTRDDSCYIKIDSSAGGLLYLQNDDADDACISMQWAYDIFSLDTSYAINYANDTTVSLYSINLGAAKLGEARQSEFFLGYAQEDTSLHDGVRDGVYFFKADGYDSALCINIRNAVGDTTIVDNVFEDSVMVTFQIQFNGRNRIKFSIDDRVVATHTTVSLMPADVPMRPSILWQNGTSGTEEVCWLDYIYHRQKRAVKMRK